MELAGSQPKPEAAREVDLSVVVPIYNEEACIVALWPRLYAVLIDLELSWEVLFVDDGSTDRSRERLVELASDGSGRSGPFERGEVRVVALARNSGQTAAFDAGFRAAHGRWVATLDADLQNPPEELPKLLEAADGVDLVYGRRVRRMDGRLKRIGSRIGNGVRNLITGHRVRDTGCSLKLYRAAALRRIPLFTGMHRFLPTLFHYHGFRIREVEVEHAERFGGASKYTNFGRAMRGLFDCFAVRWMRRRSLGYSSREIGDDQGRDHRNRG